jgi:hypothetical protein
MSQEQINKAQQDLQAKIERLISGGAGCIVVDENGDFVTELLLSSFEVFKAIPFFDRTTGKIVRYDFWVFFQEFYFDQGMQYSHLIRMNKVDWIHEDYVVMVNADGWTYHISIFDLKEVDPRPHELLKNWQRYYQDNGLAKAAAKLRSEYYEMMEAQL